MIKQIKLKYILLVFLTIFFIGCTHKAPYTDRSQMIFMSHDQELALGEKSYKETLQKSKVIKILKMQIKLNVYEALNFWKNMSEGKESGNEFFSTHPSSSTRIANIKRVISDIEENQKQSLIRPIQYNNLGKRIN